jgi:hypothetical protein
MEKVLESIARAILEQLCGHGSWSRDRKYRTKPSDDNGVKKGLTAGDTIYYWDTDTAGFEEELVVYVDCNGVAYFVSDDEGESPPELRVVYDYWHNSKRAASESEIAQLRTWIADIEKEFA